MTLQRILQAAVDSLAQGNLWPHCYRAYVDGQGYINDGSTAYNRADYERQAVQSAQSEVDNIGYATHYAEPGYSQPCHGVVMANWNHFPTAVAPLVERAGYSAEWSDEWFVCDCGGAVRTSPNGHDWTPSYREVDNELLCIECAAGHSTDMDDDTSVDATD
jgi:hypothetical protein